MTKSNPTKDPEFQRVLKNMLSTPPKPHSQMKVDRGSKRAKVARKLKVPKTSRDS